MSTHTITTAPVGGFAVERAASTGAKPGKGFFRRVFEAMVASREAEANRLIQQYMSRLSEQERKDLGYPADGQRGR